MVRLTRLNHQEVIVHAAHIVTVESTPDTLITLYNGEKLLVLEKPEEVTDRVVGFYRSVSRVPFTILPADNRTLEDSGG
jgi:flagellar protein FlbD